MIDVYIDEKKYECVDIVNFDLGQIMNQDNKTNIIKFGILNCDNEKCLWEFCTKNAKWMRNIRSIHLAQQFERSKAIKYFDKQLELNKIHYKMTSFFETTFFLHDNCLNLCKRDVYELVSFAHFMSKYAN